MRARAPSRSPRRRRAYASSRPAYARSGAGRRRVGRDVVQRLLDLARDRRGPTPTTPCGAPGTTSARARRAPRREARRGARARRSSRRGRPPGQTTASADRATGRDATRGARGEPERRGGRRAERSRQGKRSAGGASGARLSCAAPRAVKLGGVLERPAPLRRRAGDRIAGARLVRDCKRARPRYAVMPTDLRESGTPEPRMHSRPEMTTPATIASASTARRSGQPRPRSRRRVATASGRLRQSRRAGQDAPPPPVGEERLRPGADVLSQGRVPPHAAGPGAEPDGDGSRGWRPPGSSACSRAPSTRSTTSSTSRPIASTPSSATARSRAASSRSALARAMAVAPRRRSRSAIAVPGWRRRSRSSRSSTSPRTSPTASS